MSNGNTVAFTVGVTGGAPFSYQWQFNGSNLLGNSDISTLVGTGVSGYFGDGGFATNAELSRPQGLANDSAGNLYIADTYNYVVRRVDAAGVVTTVAGNGIQGYSGDGGPATNASLNVPTSVFVDTDGNIYIADYFNQRVRKVDAGGIITTFAGNGAIAFAGDGGPATNASFFYPVCALVDHAGNVIIADQWNNRIRKVDTNGIVTTIAGDGDGGYSGDGGEAVSNSLSLPEGLALDSSGNLFIADHGNNRIRMVDTNGLLNTIAGNGAAGYSGDGGPGTNAAMNTPTDVTVDVDGNVFFTDFNNNRVRKIAANGIISTLAGNGGEGFSGDGGPAAQATLSQPFGVLAESRGSVLIADWNNNRIRSVAGGAPIFEIAHVSPGDAGDYDVVISNSFGSVTSVVAVLTVDSAAGITSQPESQVVEVGNNTSFNVSATGTAPLGYQWYASTAAETASAAPTVINGFVVSATVTSGGTGYSNAPQVQIVGGGGREATASAVVSNSVVTAVQILSAGSGYTNSPAIVIGGPPLTPLPGQTSALLALNSVNPGQAGSYLVVVTNAYGSATSSVVILTVDLAPAITVEPEGQNVPFGGNAAMVVVAEGGGTLQYQWYVSPDQNIASAVAEIFNGFVVGATIINSGAGYTNAPQVSILDGGGAGATATATITNGSVSSVNILDAGAGYTNAPLLEIAAPGFAPLVGQTNAMLSLFAVTTSRSGEYFVVITNAYGSVTSSVVAVNVGIPPLNVSFSPGVGLQMGFSTVPGSTYILQTTTNLMPPVVWQSVYTNTADGSGRWAFVDTNTLSYSERFYRVATQ